MLNKCCFIGNVGKDPEIRSSQSGKEIANFSLAVTEKWKDHATGEKKERTEWVRICVFNEGLVGVIKQYIKKGSKIYVEGSLATRKWTDQSGTEKYSTEVVLKGFGGTLVMLGDPQGSGQGRQVPAAAVPASGGSLLDDQDIPF
jgi:single-strand DNA-binding protein